MDKQFGAQLQETKVNEATKTMKPGRGALFGTQGPSKYNFEGEKAHKYFNKIDTSYMM